MKLRVLLAAVCVALAACSTVELKKENFSLVSAKQLKDNAPSELTDQFDLNGNVYVYITSTWPEMNKYGGRRDVQVKWYMNEKLVASGKNNFEFKQSPKTFWFWQPSVSLGAGQGRADLYVDGVLMGSKSFTITK